jgi:hypothetical protein
MNKNMSPAPGIKLIFGLGNRLKFFNIDKTTILNIVAFKQKIRIFLNMVAVHIKGWSLKIYF